MAAASVTHPAVIRRYCSLMSMSRMIARNITGGMIHHSRPLMPGIVPLLGALRGGSFRRVVG
jgi:hypothetical protein